ncbi:MAG: cytochrome ubiquinol oxidase subunit I [Muribaculaceae bacterium]|nr:cytochrome ubiquinol oxidase subunit I [Muribaculaceae bacterium]
MYDLIGVVDWSRAQFALTAMYHWLFVPLTIGLALIIAIMETLYVRTGQERWKGITKFWMTLFGINFACGIATGLILEFEFGTNWSNYSWFVGDIFGAPLAIEGLLAFFMEATFVAVMFFGWNKVSRGFHLASTWLTALGVSLSALWILVANAWMQHPVGMEFDPAQMRNVMSDFWTVAFNSFAINKFMHTTFSAWTLAGVFVIGVSSWLLLRKRNISAALSSIKVGAWVGLAGIVLTLSTGHGSAALVSRVQPMKLAAMEGLYRGKAGQDLVAIGVLKPESNRTPDDPMAFSIDLPKGLSYLIYSDGEHFVPGVYDLIDGISLTADGDTLRGLSYAEKMEIGRRAQDALRDYDNARKADDKEAMDVAAAAVKENFAYFGYGYLPTPEAAIPNVALSFYSFHIMVIAGGYLLLLFIAVLFFCYRKAEILKRPWMCWIGILSIAVVWICSQAGWVLAEVGRQPWVIQDLMPTSAAISGIPTYSVKLTFWMFAAIFTGLLIAEISIMLRYISSASKSDIENPKH